MVLPGICRGVAVLCVTALLRAAYAPETPLSACHCRHKLPSPAPRPLSLPPPASPSRATTPHPSPPPTPLPRRPHLPRAQVQAALCDGDGETGAEHGALDVRRHVVWPLVRVHPGGAAALTEVGAWVSVWVGGWVCMQQ